MPYGPKRGYSDAIRPAKVRDLNEAATFAEAIGRPLNTCVDVNWTRTSAGDDTQGAKLALMLKKIRRWLHPGNIELFALWVRENPPRRGSTGGPNSHIMLWLPLARLKEFQQAALAFLPDGYRDLDGRSVRIHPTQWTRAARASRVRYVSKGVKEGSVATALGIEPQAQGRIFGKRCGVTENLSLAARRRKRVTITTTAAAPKVQDQAA